MHDEVLFVMIGQWCLTILIIYVKSQTGTTIMQVNFVIIAIITLLWLFQIS